MKQPPQPADTGKKAQASRLMRRKILQVTIDIVGSEGYAALTASKLSQQAGISKGALYHHFANLEEVRRHALMLLLEMFMAARDPNLFASLEDYLATAGEALFAQMEEQPVAMKAMYAFVFQALVDDTLRRQILQLVEHGLVQYRHAIQHFYPALSPQRLERVVLVMDAYLAGAGMHWFLLEDGAMCRAGWRLFTAMLLDSLNTGE